MFDGVAGVEPQSGLTGDMHQMLWCLVSVISTSLIVWVLISIAAINLSDRLSKKAVRMHANRRRGNFDGIIDLLTMKEVKFTGDKVKMYLSMKIAPEHLEGKDSPCRDD